MTIQKQEPGQAIRYEADGAEVALSVSYVRQYFCPKATNEEAFGFIRFCQYHSLNPFLGTPT